MQSKATSLQIRVLRSSCIHLAICFNSKWELLIYCRSLFYFANTCFFPISFSFDGILYKFYVKLLELTSARMRSQRGYWVLGLYGAESRMCALLLHLQ